ncbi:hypothetical protein L228DRAFT_257858 [Xylona heveae TC161]|uniref:Mediator of RNA polymerase II transcription subunit 16 n=1 Tax=Xylona heveae (strain CBS 132557 / TC161) TaxID=1328760 RepID=A0A165JM51_XYLHT|nr:hypothetical protein L228DRAFT_257858 [Xylona heveae TC161]KZF26413.1 hypothetical protein L228DRAFT_257858 [Xylona heveae TC161]
MPLMMDDALDMADLFGDAQPLQLPPLPPAKGLLQRLDEMRLSGCCQKVAWSKVGCIAYVTRDGQRVAIRNLRCSPRDGSWGLSHVSYIQSLPSVPEGQQVAHLSFNPPGTELAIVDVAGRITFANLVITVNRTSVVHSGLIDQVDDLGAIVGLSWLNVDRVSPLYRPAVRKDGQWVYSAGNVKNNGPHHPLNKSALLAITRGGSLRFLYQQTNGKWHETGAELESVGSSNDLLTHASICCDKDGSLLVVTHNVSQRLRIYRITISWNLAPGHKQPQTAPLPIPGIAVRHLKVENSCSPLTKALASDGTVSHIDPQTAQLSHLEFASAEPDLNGREPRYPTIFAVFSHLPENDSTEKALESFSVIARWELRPVSQSLHSSFNQLASKKNNVGASRESLELSRLEDYVSEKSILSTQFLNLNTVVAFGKSDGSIVFHNRDSMSVISSDPDLNKVSGLAEAGFAFPAEETCLHVTLSPNACGAVTIDAEGEARFKPMQYTLQKFNDSKDDARFSVAIIAFALQFAFSCTHHNNNDDIVAAIQPHAAPAFQHAFLSEIFRALAINADWSFDNIQDKLFRNNVMHRCLSMQGILGFRGEHANKSLTAKLARAALNLRITSFSFIFALNNAARPGSTGGDTEAAMPETLISLSGVVKWSMDLVNYIVDELFRLAHVCKDHTDDKGFLNDKIRQLNSPALFLVLCSVPRLFLRYNVRGIRSVHTAAHRSSRLGPSSEHWQALLRIAEGLEESPVPIVLFDRVLNEMDQAIKSAYQGSGMSDAERNQAEKEMLIHGDIPDALVPVISRLLTDTLNKIAMEMDPAEIYFVDHSWLDLSDDLRTDAYRRQHRVDAIRKVPLSGSATLRRCTRCCLYMEDFIPQRTGWLSGLQMRCLCGNLWMLIESSG